MQLILLVKIVTFKLIFRYFHFGYCIFLTQNLYLFVKVIETKKKSISSAIDINLKFVESNKLSDSRK